MNKYGGGGEERKRCGVGGKKSGGGAGQERKIGREVGARNQEPLGGRVAALSARPGEAHHRCTGHRARDSDRLTASNHTPRSRPRAAEPVGELATRTQTTPRVTGRGTEQGHHTTTTDAPSSTSNSSRPDSWPGEGEEGGSMVVAHQTGTHLEAGAAA